MVETVLTPTHPDPFEALLDKPFAGTLDVSTIIRSSRQLFSQSCDMIDLLYNDEVLVQWDAAIESES